MHKQSTFCSWRNSVTFRNTVCSECNILTEDVIVTSVGTCHREFLIIVEINIGQKVLIEVANVRIGTIVLAALAFDFGGAISAHDEMIKVFDKVANMLSCTVNVIVLQQKQLCYNKEGELVGIGWGGKFTRNKKHTEVHEVLEPD